MKKYPGKKEIGSMKKLFKDTSVNRGESRHCSWRHPTLNKNISSIVKTFEYSADFGEI